MKLNAVSIKDNISSTINNKTNAAVSFCSIKKSDSFDTFEFSSKTDSVQKDGFFAKVFRKKPAKSPQENIIEQFKNNEIYLNMKIAVDKELMEEFLNSPDSSRGVKYVNPERFNRSGESFTADKAFIKDDISSHKGRNVEGLVKLLGSPMLIRGLKVYDSVINNNNGKKEFADGVQTANNITVFDKDEKGNIIGATIYHDVKLEDMVFPIDVNDELSSLTRFYASEVYKIKDGKPVSYMLGCTKILNNEFLSNEQIDTSAKSAIEFLADEVVDVYTDFEQKGHEIPSGKSEELIKIK